MSYYRAALSAAQAGDLADAARLTRLSLALGENAPSAARLLELLEQNAGNAAGNDWRRLRELADARQYKRALPIRPRSTAAAYNAQGLLFALLGRRHGARKSFHMAQEIDPGNDLAARALGVIGKRRGYKREPL